MAAGGCISYWMIPVFSSLAWLGTLLGLLLHWVVTTGRRRYPDMAAHASVAYISNIGAHELKPLFVAGSAATAASLDLALAADRWLRHRGRLVPKASPAETVLAALTLALAVVGTAGLVLLAVFDTWRHKRLHNVFLLLFIASYWLSAVFACCEYQLLGAKNREHRILRSSFWTKLAFILVELALAAVFIAASFTGRPNVAAVLEWIVAFIFTFYILSFAIDLAPAVRKKDPAARFQKPRDAEHAPAASSSRSNRHDQRRYAMGPHPPTLHVA